MPCHMKANLGSCFLVLIAALACRYKGETPTDPYGGAKGKEPPAADYNAGPLAGKLPVSSATPVAVDPAVSGRPSKDDDMGRAFQGVMELRIEHRQQSPLSLRFMSLGNAARLQCEGGPRSFDVLILDEKLVTLDHAQRRYKTQLQGEPEAPEGDNVKTKHLDTRQTIEGVICDDWTLTDGTQRIEACLAGLPGEFNPAKLAAATGIHLPNWVAALFADKYLPVIAKVYDASQRELYSLRLSKWAPGPVDPALLTVPSNYQPM
jgi:hypothetical protein